MGEIGTKLLLQRIAEQNREQRMLRDAAQENKFRKLPNPTSPRNDKLVHNLSSKELTKDQIQTRATEETKSLIRHQVSSLLMAHRPQDVLSKVERDGLRELKADKDLVIVPADKGRSMVALDRTDYLQKAKGAITPTDRRMARPQDMALARYYGLPKVHKDGAPLRPIVSLKGTPTYGLAKWLFRRLTFLTAESDTTVSSSAQFRKKLKGVSLHPNEVMVSFDVTSVFTSILRDLAIETIELLLQGKYDETENRLGYAQVLQLPMFCLRTHCTFDGTIYEQVKGTPVGSPIRDSSPRLSCNGWSRWSSKTTDRSSGPGMWMISSRPKDPLPRQETSGVVYRI
ncbi:hypothetical protein SprV_0702368500 [Sparganum proliferum]